METQVHGVLVRVMDVGVLLLGPSGIGKSECALELITRGHQLVADDVVRMRPGPDGRVLGIAPEIIRHFMEIRGVGIFSVPELFGPDSVREEGQVDLVCRIVPWDEGEDFERVGIDRPTEKIGGVALPILVLPARPSGNMATLVELAARDHRHRSGGLSAAERLDARILDSDRSGS